MLRPIISISNMTPEEAVISLTELFAKELKQSQRLSDRIVKLENKIDQRDLQINYLQGQIRQYQDEHTRLIDELIKYKRQQAPATNFNIK